jgi:uroporphyrinogen III methyltransferase/synthase
MIEQSKPKQGIIYFVGAGPGEPGLITVKGLALLREADAIVADLALHALLVQEARPEAERYDTGSLRRGNKKPQAAINQLLITLAQAGKTVVRLSAGDSFVFGRAAEEMAEAKQAGLAVAVVPGVTSAIAAPAYAGVPVTRWDYGASFAVVSGFTPTGSPQPNWPALAQIDPLIILMPLENLAEVGERLRAAGRSPETPVLLIEQGTLPAQRQISATLATLVETVRANPIEHPAILMVGEITRLAATLAWFEPSGDYPLLGQRVLVTRPEHQSFKLIAGLRALGAEPIPFPTIKVVPLANTSPLDTAIERLLPPPQEGELRGGYDWLVLTSANGVVAFWERLQAAGLDARHLAQVRIAAIGPATAEALWQRSIKPDLIPQHYTAEGILEAFDRLGVLAGQRFLLARADIARKALTDGLRERGVLVDEVASYHTVPLTNGPLPPAADIVTFTSSSTVQGYVNCLGGRSPAEFLQHSWVVCIGPVTAATAKEQGVPVHSIAAEYTIKGLLAALQQK